MVPSYLVMIICWEVYFASDTLLTETAPPILAYCSWIWWYTILSPTNFLVNRLSLILLTVLYVGPCHWNYMSTRLLSFWWSKDFQPDNEDDISFVNLWIKYYTYMYIFRLQSVHSISFKFNNQTKPNQNQTWPIFSNFLISFYETKPDQTGPDCNKPSQRQNQTVTFFLLWPKFYLISGHVFGRLESNVVMQMLGKGRRIINEHVSEVQTGGHDLAGLKKQGWYSG